ncbi:MAG TPA: addiction module protein [Ignavibacteriales bacterium]|nr:addiction module protein [Ignavibacteriales bacterium]
MLSNQDSGAKSIDIKNLSLKEKISLVEDIWDEISNNQNYLYVSDEQKKELDSRLSKYKLNLAESKKWSIVREEIKSKLK